MTALETEYFKRTKNVKIWSRLKSITFAITLLLLIIDLILIAIQFVLPRYGIFTNSITGQSMQPTIYEDWAIVLDTRVDINDLKTGDIISYRKDDHNVCHRLHNQVGSDKRTLFVAKGDHNEVTDQLIITKQNLNGKVIATIPYGAWLIRVNPFTLAIIALALDAISYLIHMKTYAEQVALWQVTPEYWTFIYNNSR